MTDQDRTGTPLIDELDRLRRRVTELESERAAKRAGSEESFRSIIENAAEGILIADSATMGFRHANPAICLMLGYSEAELTQMSVPDIHPRDALEHVTAEFVAQLSGEKSTTHNLPCLRKDGSLLFVDVTVGNVTIEGRRCSVGFFTDVTDRQIAENALRVSARTYREIFDAAGDAMFIHEPDTGTILDVNQAMCILYGYSRTEALKLTVADMSLGQPPYSQVEARELIRKAVYEGPQRFEWLCKKRNGELFWCEVNLKRAVLAGQERILAMVRDISDKKQAEEALRASERNYREIFNAANDAIAIIDPKTGWILDVNQADTKMSGYARDEALALKAGALSDDLSDVNETSIQEWLQRTIDEGPQTIERQCRRKDGSTYWAEISLKRAVIGGEERVLSVARDITSRRQAERVTRLQRDLAQGLSAAIDLDEALKLTLDLAIAASGMDSGGIYLVEEAIRAVELRCSRNLSEEFVACARRHDSESPQAKIVFRGLPVYMTSDDLARQMNLPTIPEQMAALAILPIIHEGRPLACLNVSSHTAAEINPASRNVLEAMAAEIGGTISRLRTQEALGESEERFRQLAENIQEVFWVGAPDWSEISYISPAYERVWGRSCQSLYDDAGSWHEAIHPDDRPALMAYLQERVESGDITQIDFPEYRIVRPDHTVRWILARSFAICDEAGRPVRVVGRAEDITARKQAEEAVRQSEMKFRALTENVSDLTVILAEDGTFSYVSPSVRKLLGYAPEEIPGAGFAGVVHADDVAVVEEAVAEAQRRSGRTIPASDIRVRHKGGGWLCLEPLFTAMIDVPGVNGIVVNCHDITQRKQAEAALVESERRFQDIAMSSADWIWEADSNGCYTFASGRVRAILGYEVEDLIGSNVMDHLVPEERERVDRMLRQCAASGEPLVDLENWNFSKNGERVCLLTNAKPIVGDDGALLGYRGVGKDITARKQRLAALREASDIISKSPAVAFLWRNRPDWPIDFVTDNVAGLCGYSAEELKNGNVAYTKLIHPDDFDRVAAEVVRFSADPDRTGFAHKPYRIVARDGAIKWVEDATEFRRNAAGEITHFQGLVIDITERKRIEEALAESEKRYHEIFDTVQEGISAVDENEVVQLANPAFARILGEDCVEAVVGRSLFEYVTEEYAEVIRRGTIRRRANESSQYELEVVTRRGDSRTVLVSVTPRFDRNGCYRGASGAMLDITDRKRAEQALKASEDSYRTLSENLPGLVFRVLCRENNRMQFFGHQLEAMTGYSPDEKLSGEPCSIVPMVLEEDRDGVIAEVERAVVEKRPFELGYRIRHKDGRVRHFQERGRPVFDADDTLVSLDGVIFDVTETTQVQAALKASEEKYRSYVAYAPIGVFVLGADGLMQEANRAMTDLTGYTEADLFNQSPVDYFSAAHRESGRRHLQALLATGFSSGELWIRRKDGGDICLLINAGRLADGRYLGYCIDTSERKKAEEALAEAEEKYRLLFEKAGEGIVVIQDGRLIFVNPAWQDIMGLDSEELGSRPFHSFVHPEDRDRVIDYYNRRLAGDEAPASYDFRVVGDDGSARWVRVSPTVILWEGEKATLAFLADVTERRLAEEEIRKFKTISDNASYGTVIADMDLNVLYVNDCFARMHGYTPQELLGKHHTFCHSEDQMQAVTTVADALIRTGSISSVELWNRHRDGTVFPTLMNGNVITDDAGQPRFIAITTIDITETKRLQEFADRAKRLETAGRIAGQVAHDFNNLLGPLVAYPEFIKEELGHGHAAIAYLESMEVAAQQMAEINQQLLTLGRRGHYNLEPINLNQTVRQVVRQMHTLPETMAVETALAPDLGTIKAGVSQIFRVITNLISNAVDSMQGIGSLTVTSENWSSDRAAGSYGQIPQGQYVRLTVTDTGCGIPDSIVANVFEPFFTTKRADKRKGSGLGLSVVHAVMEDHDGYIDLTSRVGQGTSVQLYFPVTLEPVSAEASDTTPGGTESILVIDDDDVQREVTLRILERLGYRGHAVASGEEAVAYLQSQPCDLILLDMIMPGGIDGAETYRRARRIIPELRAVIVSGYAESGRVADVQRLGAGAFIRKPLTIKSIATAVRCELDRARTAESVE